jgi:hypothetical protein
MSKESGERYRKAEVVHVLDGKEEVLTSLTLGPTNVRKNGRLEVLIQTSREMTLVASLAHVAGGSSAYTRSAPTRSMYGLDSFGMGYGSDEWQAETLLMGGGEAGSSSFIDDPENLEKVLLRLVE